MVADEIQKLAKGTQASAAEIGKIIQEMIGAIEQIGRSTEEVKASIRSGSVEVRSATDSLRNISGRVMELNLVVKNIREITSREGKDVGDIIRQVKSTHDISKDNTAAADRILAALEQQSASSQEFSAMSQELVAVSNSLEELTRRFKTS